MNKTGLFAVAMAAVLVIAGETSGQDPGLPDSMIIGNLDGSVIRVGLDEQITLPVWVKTDDSVTFIHIPLASDNDYIRTRSGGQLYFPLNFWDNVEFLDPDENSPEPGMTSQSILGYAYLADPRDPQNFLMTDYEWWYVADYLMTTTDNSGVIGDTTWLVEGSNPNFGGLIWTLQDGVTQVDPAAVYPRLYFSENLDPEFTEPPEGAEFEVNQEFPIVFNVIATDGDGDNINVTVDFSGEGFSFDPVEIAPGYSEYRFRWVPGQADEGSYPVTFIADDGHGGLAELHITIDVSSSMLEVYEVSALPGSDVTVPLSLANNGITSYVSGFEILLQYEEDITPLQSISRSERIQGWEYFNYTFGDSSTVRIVGIANLTGGGQPLVPGIGPIAFLHFEVDPDETYIGHYASINLIRSDDNDNTLADSSGYYLIHPVLDDGWIYIMDPDDITTGDINLNGIPWEVSDAVLFANHFIYPDLFPFTWIQMLASDTNGDGLPCTLADLVYLINVLNGDIPPPRVAYGDDSKAIISLRNSGECENRVTFRYQSTVAAGGVLVRLAHIGTQLGEPVSTTDMMMMYNDDNGILSVLLYDMDGDYIEANEELFEVEIISGESFFSFTEIQVSDRFGNVVTAEGRIESAIPERFSLQGAYPNPFNSWTAIRFSLPVKSDIDLTIYDVLGRVVRTFIFKNLAAGERSITWDGTDDNRQVVSSGVYLYRLEAGEFHANSRMTLLK